jgi:Hydrazine synthase alpha subunit middle domain
VQLRLHGLPLLLISFFLSVVSFAAVTPNTPSVIFTATKGFNSEAWIRGGERFPVGAHLWIRDSKGQRQLFPAFTVSADANVSFDGTRILFAGKRRPDDHWQIWEASINGDDPKQITNCKDQCIRPLYLPDARIVFAERKSGRFVIQTVPLDAAGAPQKNGARSLSSGRSDASEPTPLTFIPGNALPTDVLRDGRVLFEAAYPLGAGTKAELYTVYTDGSGVESYRCDHGADRHSGKQVSSGDIVFVSDNALARFTSPLAHADPISAPKGQFAGDVLQMPSGEWLLSWRPDVTQTLRLVQWKPGAATLEPVAAQDGFNLLQPVLLASRPIPNRHPSGLHDWPNANVLCLNAYTSKYHFEPGSIATVKVYTPGPSGQPKLIGSSPVETDGSFFLHVPSDQPIKFELLDASGKTLKKEAGWFWMRRGEQRICVGCHAGPERAPDNGVPKVLLKSTNPVDMTLEVAHTRAGGH